MLINACARVNIPARGLYLCGSRMRASNFVHIHTDIEKYPHAVTCLAKKLWGRANNCIRIMGERHNSLHKEENFGPKFLVKTLGSGLIKSTI